MYLLMGGLNLIIFFPCRNKDGNTPLHLACMRNWNIGIVKELIAAASRISVSSDEVQVEVIDLLEAKYVAKAGNCFVVTDFNEYEFKFYTLLWCL